MLSKRFGTVKVNGPSPMATIRDVARLAGVSVSTVSAALNDSAPVSAQLRSRIHEAIAAVGYAPDAVARSLRKGATSMIALVVSDIANPFFANLTRAVEGACGAAGYSLVLYTTNEDVAKERLILQAVRAQRVAGLVLAGAGTGAAYGREIQTLITAPAVLIDRVVAGLPYDSVVLDNRKAAAMATEYLLRIGHRHIAVVAGRPGVSTNDDRVAGYREALAAAGVAAPPTLVLEANFRFPDAYRAVQQAMAREPRPTAFLALNNMMTIGVMRALADMGFLCPDHVSVAGFDDFEWATAFRPRLTTVVQPIAEMGEKAAALLFARLAEPRSEPRTVVLEPRLAVRDSCRPL